MAVLDHLQKATTKPGMNSESLQEAIFAISNAYTLNMHSSSNKQRYPTDGLSLPQVYKAGREALLSSSPTAASTADRADSSVVDAGFEKFVKKLEASTSFFNGIEKSSDEYKKRIELARQKYDSKLQAKKQKIDSTPAATPATAPSTDLQMEADQANMKTENTEEEKARAKQIKEKGNAQLKAKQYELALQSYSECIELDSGNAVYYSNRAAANILLSRYTDAVDDCKKAMSLDPNFERPCERLASAYRHLGMTKNEVDCLRSASRQFPSNSTFKNMLQDAEQRLSAENSSSGIGERGMNSSPFSANPAGMGNGGAGGPAGFDPAMLDMMSRSMGVNLPEGMAESLASSGMMNQVSQMMRDNPGMVNQMMRMMGGGGANNNSNEGSGQQ